MWSWWWIWMIPLWWPLVAKTAHYYCNRGNWPMWNVIFNHPTSDFGLLTQLRIFEWVFSFVVVVIVVVAAVVIVWWIFPWDHQLYCPYPTPKTNTWYYIYQLQWQQQQLLQQLLLLGWYEPSIHTSLAAHGVTLTSQSTMIKPARSLGQVSGSSYFTLTLLLKCLFLIIQKWIVAHGFILVIILDAVFHSASAFCICP